MKLFNLFMILSWILVHTTCMNRNPSDVIVPFAEKIDTVLIEHENQRIDSYYWMRLTDAQKYDSTKSKRKSNVLKYLNAENSYTRKVMSDTKDLQMKLYDEMINRITQNQKSVPYFSNKYWYYFEYKQGFEYPIHFRKKASLSAEEEIILDVNEYVGDNNYFDVQRLLISPDNKTLAFSVDTEGRRRYSIYFKDLESGELLDDRIDNALEGGAWASNGSTYFYTLRDSVSLRPSKIYRHEIGTNTNDVLVYQEVDPSYSTGVYTTRSLDYIVIWSHSTEVSDYQILSTNNPYGKFKNFTPRSEKRHRYFIDHVDQEFFIRTNINSNNFQLMKTDVSNTSLTNWKEVVPIDEGSTLQGFVVFDDYLVLNERKSGSTRFRILNRDSNEEHYMKFSESAFSATFSMNSEISSDDLRYSYNSLSTPPSTFEYNLKSRKLTLLDQESVEGDFKPYNYFTERIYAQARDGEKIPMSIVYKKGFKKDKNNPFLIHCYGAYGAIYEPRFSSNMLSLLDRGFGFAIAHVRGSGILGQEWYDQGRLSNKKNSINDLIDCAKYLINEGYTSSDHIYAQGGSAGGLVIGGAINQEPTLFNGVIAAVPFVDLISTMWDETIPLTSNEFREWGNPKIPESYKYMIEYSPYDNIKSQPYPNILITGAYYDSQVQYWEPAKWTAKLREHSTSNNFIILKTDMESGHYGGSGRFKRYEDRAFKFAFLLKLEDIEE